MAQPASTTATGNAVIQHLPDRVEPVVIDIQWIAEQARLSTVSIIQVIGHYTDMMACTNNAAVLNYLNSMAAPVLHNLQSDLQSLQWQMTTYANVMNPGSPEYHKIQANAEEAITIAEIYLSSGGGLQSYPQIQTQLSPYLPATILRPAVANLNPVQVQHEQMEHIETSTAIINSQIKSK